MASPGQPPHGCAMYIRDRIHATIFAVTMCAFYWTLSVVGSYGPQIKVALPYLQFAIGSKFVLLMAASLIPAIFCMAVYPECRSVFRKLSARWTVYLVAILAGAMLPLFSYFGSHDPSFPWGRPAAISWIRVFALNLLLSPLWEEIIWRGCFLKGVRSFSSASGGILLGAAVSTIWYGGFIAYLYSEGIPIDVLCVLPFLYFCSGIIFGAIFEMAGGSLWPCVLFHAGMNASTLVYYQSAGRASELSSYIAEVIVLAIAAAIFFWRVSRKKYLPSVEQGLKPQC